MPKLWNETIEAHRRDVRDAIIATTWALVSERGLLSVTMSQIAEATGIGRGTLYKYFPDVEAILLTHHQRHVEDHLQRLTELRDGPGDPGERLHAVLEAFALISHHRVRHARPELAALLHRGEGIAEAQRQLVELFRGLLAELAATGAIRTDVEPYELAQYCIHALAAAGRLPSEAGVRRLVAVTLAGLAPQ